MFNEISWQDWNQCILSLSQFLAGIGRKAYRGDVYKLLLGCADNAGNKGIWCPYKTLKCKKSIKTPEFGVPIGP